VTCILFIDIQGLLAGYGMLSDNRVYIFDGLASEATTPLGRLVIISLRNFGVDSLQCAQESNKSGRKLLESQNLGTKESVAPCGRLRKQEESGESGRLELERNI
jgi:hypothetical protein